MKIMTRSFVVLVFSLAPAIAHAQRIAPAGVVRLRQLPDSSVTAGRGGYRFATRTLTAAVGGTAAAFGIGLLAASFAPDCGGCEDPSLREFVAGFVIGATVGSGVGAALPRFGGDRCTLGTRMWRAIGGAAVGGVTGGLLGSLAGETSLAVGWATGTALGAPVALIGC